MNNIQLKPCPYCQSDNVGVECSRGSDDDGMIRHFYYGFCGGCHMAGPDVSNEEGEGIAEEQAAEAWNALPRPLRWTKEKPTKEGWYWYRDKVTEPIMSLITTLDHQLVMNAYRRYQNAFIDRLDGEYDEEWAGPIPEPQEPQ